MTRVAHLTSVHPQPDARILLKECRTLAAAGFQTTLVAPADQDEVVDGVEIRAINRAGGRARRMTQGVRDLYRAARAVDADLYHFHDPELLGVGVRLQRLGRRVVYDAHEDVVGDILSKYWIAPPLRAPVARAFGRAELAATARLDAVVTAGPDITGRFAREGTRALTVANYPIVSELETDGRAWAEREQAVCYTGALTVLRGLVQMVDAADRAGVSLLLHGSYTEAGARERAAARHGWRRVEELGPAEGGGAQGGGGIGDAILRRRRDIGALFSRAAAGLLVVQPAPNHLQMHRRSHKLFEYMAAGLPVIVADFPDWRRFVAEHDCGICVDPTDPVAIAAAIRRLIDDPAEAERLGANGRAAVERCYRWEREGERLVELYESLV